MFPITVYKLSVIILSLFIVATNTAYSASGEDIYNNNCVLCHGEYVQGVMPGVPDLYVNKTWIIKTDSELVKRINEGIQSKDTTIAMPPKGGNPNLNDEDVKASLKYMRTLVKEQN